MPVTGFIHSLVLAGSIEYGCAADHGTKESCNSRANSGFFGGDKSVNNGDNRRKSCHLMLRSKLRGENHP
jgi:hypothetical protein